MIASAVRRRPVAPVLAQFGRGDPITGPAAVVVAHPDDETVGLGARLHTFRDLVLVHVTDGAPEALDDARRAGLGDREAYRRARAGELALALEALQIAPRSIRFDLRDQETAFHLPRLVRALASVLENVELVVTHPYEGGHPDHDAVAFAVQVACKRLERQGRPTPLRLEFAGYHLAGGRCATGAFWSDPARPAVGAAIGEAELARKRAALACFGSQAEVVAWFEPGVEAYRQAPDYDFARPPPPGAALYDGWDIALTNGAWRKRATAALVELGLRRRS